MKMKKQRGAAEKRGELREAGEFRLRRELRLRQEKQKGAKKQKKNRGCQLERKWRAAKGKNLEKRGEFSGEARNREKSYG